MNLKAEILPLIFFSGAIHQFLNPSFVVFARQFLIETLPAENPVLEIGSICLDFKN
jgi:threonine/homoserine/homoserine lactone efflux protein